MIRQPAGGTDETAHVDVVTTGVHHAHLAPGLIARCYFARIGEACIFRHRQRVHIGTNQDDRPVAVLEQSHDAKLANIGRDNRAGLLQFLGDPGRRFDLLPRQLGVGVQMGVERDSSGSLAMIQGSDPVGVCFSAAAGFDSRPDAKAFVENAIKIKMTPSSHRRRHERA